MNTTNLSVRSFFDLRTFAANATPAPGGFLEAREQLPLADGPVTVAALALYGSGRVDVMPADEFVIVLDGALTIGGATIPTNESIVLPGGIGFDWEATPGTRAIAMRCTSAPTSGPAGAQRPVRIDLAAPLSPSGAPLAELLIGPTPSCRNFTDYRSANGEFTCGTWDSTPYHRRAMHYRHYELMHLLAGSVTFVDGVGREGTFETGDVFLVEQGSDCSWESREHVKKVYAIYRPV